MFRFIFYFLATWMVVSSTLAATAGWWQQPFALYTLNEQKEASQFPVADAARGIAHGGWYGIWWKDLPALSRLEARRIQRVEEADLKTVLYFDTGELGDFLVWVTPEQSILYTGWGLHNYANEPGRIEWFGLESFFQNENPFGQPNFVDYSLSPMTWPDDRAIAEGDFYEAVASGGIDGVQIFQKASNKRLSDRTAEALGLGSVTEKQAAAKAHVVNRDGWVTTRLYKVDRANRQYTRYAAKELEAKLRSMQPDGIHFDDWAGSNIRYMTKHGFGAGAQHSFKAFLDQRLGASALNRLGIDSLDTFDVLEYFKNRPWVAEYAESRHPKRYWVDPRWLDDTIYRAYQVHLVASSLAHYRNLYKTAKRTGRELNKEIAVMGNAMPLFPGADLTKGYLDVATFEWATFKTYTVLSQPVGLPPQLRMAPFTRLAASYSNAGFCIPATYVPFDKQGAQFTALHKVMQFDCLANEAVYDFGHWYLDGYTPGTPESASFGNQLLKENRVAFSDRRPFANIGILYSGWSHIAAGLPGALPPASLERFSGEYVGWADYLTRQNVPWDVQLLESMSRESLERFQLVIVPSLLSMSDAQVETLERYVRSGGKVIVTGESAAYEGPEQLLATRNSDPLAVLKRYDRQVRMSTERPGLAWHKSPGDAEARALQEYLDGLDFRRSLESTAEPTVGLSVHEYAAGQIAIDCVNYDVDIDANRIRSTESFELTFTHPSFEGKRQLHLFELTPQSGKPVPYEGKFEYNPASQKLTLAVEPFDFYTMLIVR